MKSLSNKDLMELFYEMVNLQIPFNMVEHSINNRVSLKDSVMFFLVNNIKLIKNFFKENEFCKVNVITGQILGSKKKVTLDYLIPEMGDKHFPSQFYTIGHINDIHFVCNC